MKIEKLDLGFKIDVGAPRPVLLVDEHKVYLIFYTQIESKIAVVNFSYYDIFNKITSIAQEHVSFISRRNLEIYAGELFYQF